MYCSYELLYILTISNLRTFSSKSVYIETSLFYTRQRSFINISCSVMKIPSVYKILTIVTSEILCHIQENLLGTILISVCHVLRIRHQMTLYYINISEVMDDTSAVWWQGYIHDLWDGWSTASYFMILSSKSTSKLINYLSAAQPHFESNNVVSCRCVIDCNALTHHCLYSMMLDIGEINDSNILMTQRNTDCGVSVVLRVTDICLDAVKNMILWTCAWTAPSHYLNHCWVIVNLTLSIEHRWIFN